MKEQSKRYLKPGFQEIEFRGNKLEAFKMQIFMP